VTASIVFSHCSDFLSQSPLFSHQPRKVRSLKLRTVAVKQVVCGTALAGSGLFHSPTLFDAAGQHATGRQTECQPWREMPLSMTPLRRSAIHLIHVYRLALRFAPPSLRSSTVTTGFIFYEPTETVTVSVRSFAQTPASPNFKQSPFPPPFIWFNPIVTQLSLRSVVRKPQPSACRPSTWS